MNNIQKLHLVAILETARNAAEWTDGSCDRDALLKIRDIAYKLLGEPSMADIDKIKEDWSTGRWNNEKTRRHD
jgi:hypothetical protein